VFNGGNICFVCIVGINYHDHDDDFSKNIILLSKKNIDYIYN